jgi:hypothetical protein
MILRPPKYQRVSCSFSKEAECVMRASMFFLSFEQFRQSVEDIPWAAAMACYSTMADITVPFP